jgi:hypothetical protein
LISSYDFKKVKFIHKLLKIMTRNSNNSYYSQSEQYFQYSLNNWPVLK